MASKSKIIGGSLLKTRAALVGEDPKHEVLLMKGLGSIKVKKKTLASVARKAAYKKKARKTDSGTHLASIAEDENENEVSVEYVELSDEDLSESEEILESNPRLLVERITRRRLQPLAGPKLVGENPPPKGQGEEADANELNKTIEYVVISSESESEPDVVVVDPPEVEVVKEKINLVTESVHLRLSNMSKRKLFRVLRGWQNDPDPEDVDYWQDEPEPEYNPQQVLEDLVPLSDDEVHGRQYVAGAVGGVTDDFFDNARDSPWSSPERPTTDLDAARFAQVVVQAFDSWDEEEEHTGTFYAQIVQISTL